MKKKLFLLGAIALLMSSAALTAQVTVGAGTIPQATLDVVATDNSTTPVGVIAPRLSLAALKTADGAGTYKPAQTGAVVYVNDTTGLAASGTSTQTINVTAPGYYYFDGNVWQKLSGEDTNTIYTAANGLNIPSGTTRVELGGALTKNTVVSGLSETNKMNFTGTGVGAFRVDDNTFSVDATNNRIGINSSVPPTTTLQVNGAITNRDFSYPGLGVNVIDFSKSNFAQCTATGNTFVLQNLLANGTYVIFHSQASSSMGTFTEPQGAAARTQYHLDRSGTATGIRVYTIYAIGSFLFIAADLCK